LILEGKTKMVGINNKKKWYKRTKDKEKDEGRREENDKRLFIFRS
jgi:hypothetical protein